MSYLKGGAYLGGKMTSSYFNFKSALGAYYVMLKLKIKFPTHPCFDQFSHPQTYKICAPTDADWQLDSHSDMV